MSAAQSSDVVPVLVRLPHERFAFPIPSVGEFHEGARVGNIATGSGTRDALEELATIPGIVIEASRDVGELELAHSVETVKGSCPSPAPNHGGSQCIIAILDGGIDVLHEAFLDEHGQSRIHYVWDQGCTRDDDGGAPTPRTELGLPFDYGVLHSRARIARAIREQLPLPRMDGAAAHVAHGTHVASIAAGRRVAGADADDSLFPGGLAPDAPIVVVIPQMRGEAGRQVSIGYSKGHVDALAFCAAIADRLELPIVVNVSAGMSAGAHDGSSTLEAAFDAFTGNGRTPGRAIVKSAGNARTLRRYTQVELSPGRREIPLVQPTAPLSPLPRSTTLEGWFSSADDVAFQVLDDRNVASAVCSRDSKEPVTSELRGGSVTLSYTRFHHDNGDSQLLVTLPATTLGFRLIAQGRQIRSGGAFDAWLDGWLCFAESRSERTLTVPGTALTVIAVAASNSEGDQLFDYSSLGPTRDGRSKPELFAPGHEIRAAKSGTPKSTIAMSGTSMAAPHVAGAVARLFSLHHATGAVIPNAVQVRAALITSAQHSTPQFNKERGYGLLNVEAFLGAFADWR